VTSPLERHRPAGPERALVNGRDYLAWEEVLREAPAEHLRLPSHWGYRTGDCLRLRLYLEGDLIRWLSLTLPLWGWAEAGTLPPAGRSAGAAG